METPMRKTLIVLPLAALLASPAVAQGPTGGRLGPDANGDGVVTRAEESAEADRRFAAMDANHDGTVTSEERRAERDRMRAERDARVVTEDQFKDRAENRFDRLDTNDDGKLTGDERRAGHRGPGLRRGPDGPGGSGRDRPAPKPETAAEFRAHALERFDRIDANHDGRIDRAERAAAHDRMRPPPPPPGGPTPPSAR